MAKPNFYARVSAQLPEQEGAMAVHAVHQTAGIVAVKLLEMSATPTQLPIPRMACDMAIEIAEYLGIIEPVT